MEVKLQRFTSRQILIGSVFLGVVAVVALALFLPKSGPANPPSSYKLAALEEVRERLAQIDLAEKLRVETSREVRRVDPESSLTYSRKGRVAKEALLASSSSSLRARVNARLPQLGGDRTVLLTLLEKGECGKEEVVTKQKLLREFLPGVEKATWWIADKELLWESGEDKVKRGRATFDNRGRMIKVELYTQQIEEAWFASESETLRLTYPGPIPYQDVLNTC